MSFPPGRHPFGPGQAALTVHTGRGGAAARAGHDLTIAVTDWSAELNVAADPSQTTLTLNADPRSLRVREGHGGLQALGDDDRNTIARTIDATVLRQRPIAFASEVVASGDEGTSLHVQGRLTLHGRTRPLTFQLRCPDGETLSATATLRQSEWGIKPYSAMLGALKVLDEVRIAFRGQLSGGA